MYFFFHSSRTTGYLATHVRVVPATFFLWRNRSNRSTVLSLLYANIIKEQIKKNNYFLDQNKNPKVDEWRTLHVKVRFDLKKMLWKNSGIKYTHFFKVKNVQNFISFSSVLLYFRENAHRQTRAQAHTHTHTHTVWDESHEAPGLQRVGMTPEEHLGCTSLANGGSN